MMETQLAVFKGRQIRRTLHNNEWWFVKGLKLENLRDHDDFMFGQSKEEFDSLRSHFGASSWDGQLYNP